MPDAPSLPRLHPALVPNHVELTVDALAEHLRRARAIPPVPGPP